MRPLLEDALFFVERSGFGTTELRFQSGELHLHSNESSVIDGFAGAHEIMFSRTMDLPWGITAARESRQSCDMCDSYAPEYKARVLKPAPTSLRDHFVVLCPSCEAITDGHASLDRPLAEAIARRFEERGACLRSCYPQLKAQLCAAFVLGDYSGMRCVGAIQPIDRTPLSDHVEAALRDAYYAERREGPPTGDQPARAIYADWLEARGRLAEASFYRGWLQERACPTCGTLDGGARYCRECFKTLLPDEPRSE